MSEYAGRRHEAVADIATPGTDAECEPLQSNKIGPDLVSDGLIQQHECHRRDDRRIWSWKILEAWWLLPSHLAMVAIVTGVCCHINNGYFRISSRSPEGKMNDMSSPYQSNINNLPLLSQSDIVTIVTALLVITRIFAGAWQALCAWRCVYILLEKAGIRLEDIKWILSLGLLLPPLRKSSWWHLLSAVALLMAWPAMVASPVLTGSINFVPISWHTWDRSGSVSIVRAPDISSSSHGLWSEFEEYWEYRDVVVKTAAGRASLALNLFDVAAGLEPIVAQRISPVFGDPRFQGCLVDSFIAPAIYLDDGVWVDGDLPTSIEQSLLNGTSGFLNVSKHTSPLLITQLVGNAAILKDWTLQDGDVSGNPPKWIGEQYAALLIGITDDASDPDCIGALDFEHPRGRFFRTQLANDVTACYQVLKLNVTAGTTNCETPDQPDSLTSCEVGNLSVATLNHFPIGTRVPIDTTDILLPMVSNLMPEVMQSLVAMSGMGTLGVTTQEMLAPRPQLYLETIITAAYQGTWSALTSLFGQEQLQYDATTVTNLMQAQVSVPRLVGWLLVNMLLTMSGALLYMMQHFCVQPPLIDKFMPAFFHDTSELLREDCQGRCNAMRMGKKDKGLPRLRSIKPRNDQGFYHTKLQFEEVAL